MLRPERLAPLLQGLESSPGFRLADRTISRELGLVFILISISVIKIQALKKGPIHYVLIILTGYEVIYDGKFLFKY